MSRNFPVSARDVGEFAVSLAKSRRPFTEAKRVLRLSLDLHEEEEQLKELVCSPIQVSTRIYCGCVEGLFDVSKETHRPRVLAHGRPGTIANVTSNPKAVAWMVDVGSDQLAIDFLPALDPEGATP